jgi:hypothetical protein
MPCLFFGMFFAFGAERRERQVRRLIATTYFNSNYPYPNLEAQASDGHLAKKMPLPFVLGSVPFTVANSKDEVIALVHHR